ncbi:MAG TPA: transcriptional repressor LexA [Bdellovibrionota bacterium]|nr:transcriptional repressor LexA [Bdellovibrionota bacterium]
MPLTPKQKQLLAFIRSYTERQGFAPTQQEIAKKFGFKSLGTVQNYLVRLERQGLIRKAWNAKRAIELVEPKEEGTVLQLVGVVAAGKPIEAIEQRETIDVPKSMLRGGENFALRVRGDSMINEGILDGDFIVVRKQASANNGEVVVALVENEATVKTFHRRKEAIELRPANPLMKPIFVNRDKTFSIAGIVVGVMRFCGT